MVKAVLRAGLVVTPKAQFLLQEQSNSSVYRVEGLLGVGERVLESYSWIPPWQESQRCC